MVRGWNKTNWINYTNGNNECIFYIIRCKNDNEEFIKFGITSANIERRFQSKREMPYQYEILYDIKGSGEYVWNLEIKYSKLFKEYKYVPKIHFKGHSECYTFNVINKIDLKNLI
jgi:hypothetical protein